MAIKFPTSAEMQAEFHALGKKRAEILAKSMPLREKRDKEFQAAEKIFKDRSAEISRIEGGLYELDMQRGQLARALGGKTGVPK